MSIGVMSRVWAESQHAGTELLVMLALSDFSDDDGICYPSIAKLATKCRTTPRHANRLIAALVASGELEVLVGRGPMVQGGRLNLFRVRFKALKAGAKEVTNPSPPDESEGVTQEAQRGDVDVLEGVTYASVKPSLNHQEPSEKASPQPSSRKPSRRKTEQTLSVWLEAKPAGEAAIPQGDPVFEYADKVGIPGEFLHIAWKAFRAKHIASTKVQANWRATYRSYVRGNYLKLWFFDSRGECALTVAGTQAAREHDFQSGRVFDGRFAGAL